MLDIIQEVREWRESPLRDGNEQVKTVSRFLATVRSLKPISSFAFMHATMKNRVAKMVIANVLDSYK